MGTQALKMNSQRITCSLLKEFIVLVWFCLLFFVWLVGFF